MDRNKIEKGVVHAAFQVSNSTWTAGKVFLSLYDEHHLGAQTMDDLLSRGNRFIPVKTDDRVLLLNVLHIVQAKIDSNQEDDDLLRLGTKHTVWVQTVLGEEIVGDIYISLPEGRSRVKDYANATEGFIRLFLEEHTVYLNPKFVLSIHD